MDEGQGVGEASQTCYAQMTETTKQHGKFGKRHIAAIAIGAVIALGGIAAAITIGGAFAAGYIGATLFGALFATAGSGALSGILIMAAGIQKGLKSRKAEAQQMMEVEKPVKNEVEKQKPFEEEVEEQKPFEEEVEEQKEVTQQRNGTPPPTSSQVFSSALYTSTKSTTASKHITQQTPTQKTVNFITSHAESFAKRMSCDGTEICEILEDGSFTTKGNNKKIQTNISDSNNLTNINEIIENPQIIFNGESPYQAAKDIPRDCDTFYIHEEEVKKNVNETSNEFLKKVFLKIPKNEQEQFLKQLLKYPGQLLYDTNISKQNSISSIEDTYVKTANNTLNRITISLNTDGTITARSKILYCALDSEDMTLDTNSQKTVCNKLCFSDEITAIIGQSDKNFIIKTSKTNVFTANVTISDTNGTKDYAVLPNTKSTKTVLEMTYTSAQGNQPSTFTIAKPRRWHKENKTVKTLHLIDGEWK